MLFSMYISTEFPNEKDPHMVFYLFSPLILFSG